jgi:hypothetical protein
MSNSSGFALGASQSSTTTVIGVERASTTWFKASDTYFFASCACLASRVIGVQACWGRGVWIHIRGARADKCHYQVRNSNYSLLSHMEISLFQNRTAVSESSTPRAVFAPNLEKVIRSYPLLHKTEVNTISNRGRLAATWRTRSADEPTS